MNQAKRPQIYQGKIHGAGSMIVAVFTMPSFTAAMERRWRVAIDGATMEVCTGTGVTRLGGGIRTWKRRKERCMYLVSVIFTSVSVF